MRGVPVPVEDDRPRADSASSCTVARPMPLAPPVMATLAPSMRYGTARSSLPIIHLPGLVSGGDFGPVPPPRRPRSEPEQVHGLLQRLRQPLEAGGLDLHVAQADGAGERGVGDQLLATEGERNDTRALVLGVAADGDQLAPAQLVDGLAERRRMGDQGLAQGGERQLGTLAQGSAAPRAAGA